MAEDITKWNKPFIDEAFRIIKAAEEKGIILRLIGAIAIRIHCPNYSYLLDKMNRKLTDIDFVAYGKFFDKIRKLFTELGYREDFMITRLFGTNRLLFYNENPPYNHTDIFLDKLEFNHTINFRGRLELEKYTIPLAELLLEKMQIVKINEKDIIDTIVLIREHEIGESDKECINAKYIAKILANDWGFWKTVTDNLKFIKKYMQKYDMLTSEDIEDVSTKIDKILEYIDKEPKTMKWKWRAKIGTKVKWYREVEELSRGPTS